MLDPKPQSPRDPIYPGKPKEKRYEPKFGLLDKLFSSSKQKKINLANQLYENAVNDWRKLTEELKTRYVT